MPSATSYNSVAKTFHWLIAALIVAMLLIGYFMTTMGNSPLKFSLFQWHKSIGITILLLSLGRLGWRFTYTAPALPKAMPQWEKLAARGAHILFYVLIIGMPLTGWVMVSASPMNIPTILYGIIPWPHLPVIPTLENKKEIGHAASAVHYYAAWLLAGLLVLHAGAAWKHHLFDRDDVLLRMAPGFLHKFLHFLRGE
ncbi:MAG TPA: cytochrome b [Alphaproteobacteria bacterium]|nr:cytochrome b [Alphaproteobacteria bacterium]